MLYFADEAPDDIRAMAHAYGACRGLPATDIDARFVVHYGVPKLCKSENAKKVLAYADELDAGIVTFDTWAKATIGLREIDDSVMELLGEDGPIGCLLKKGVTVICTAHTPLSDTNRQSGHAGPGNAANQNAAISKTREGFKVVVQTRRGEKKELPTLSAVVARGDVPLVTWSPKAEHDKAAPRQRAARPTVAEPVTVNAAPAPAPPMTRAEKARLRAQRIRAARRKQPTEPEEW